MYNIHQTTAAIMSNIYYIHMYDYLVTLVSKAD